MSSIFGSQVATAAAATIVPTAATVVAQAQGQRAAIIDASKALTVDTPVTVPGIARPLYDHQQAAVAYVTDAIARFGGAIVGDDMGMGKTAVALAMVALWKASGQYGHGPVIIVTPPANLGGYQREIRDAFPTLTMHVVQGRKPISHVPHADVVWMSDDALTMRAHLTEGASDGKGNRVEVASRLVRAACAYVRDEAHRDKGVGGRPQTTKSRAATSLLVAQAMRDAGKPVLVLTGTLTSNRPVEAIVPIRMAGGSTLLKTIAESTTEHGFLVRYCTGRQTMVGGKVKSSWDGANDLDVLHANLRSTVYVRREKSDLGEGVLPHFGWSIVPMAFSEALLGTLTRIERDMLALIEEQHGVQAMLRAARAEAIVRITKMRQELGRVKAEAAVRYVVDLLDESDGQDSAVVFYEHGTALDALRMAFMKAGIVTCEMNGATSDRRAVEDAFQGRPALVAAVQAAAEAGDHVALAAANAALNEAPQVILAQMQSAGQAVTLTAARHAVWVQLGWSAGGLAQQRDRIRRCDDVSAARAAAGVGVQFHVLEVVRTDGRTTFDGSLWKVLEAKAKACDAVNAGREVTLSEDDVMEAALVDWYANAR